MLQVLHVIQFRILITSMLQGLCVQITSGSPMWNRGLTHLYPIEQPPERVRQFQEVIYQREQMSVNTDGYHLCMNLQPKKGTGVAV